MVAAEAVGRKLVGAGQQVSSGSLPITGERTMEGRGTPPKAPLRFWSIVLCAVTLVLACPAALRAQTFQTIAPLAFTKVYAGADPLPQVITVASTDANANFNYSSAVVNSNGGGWLSINPSPYCCATTPQAITVNANPDPTLSAGTYTGEIDFTSQNGKVKTVVPVTLTIVASTAPSFGAIAGALNFSMKIMGNAPPNQSLGIQNAGGETLNWSASASTSDGGNWLNVSAISGSAPFTLSIGVNPANLPGKGLLPGSFVGQVALQASGDGVTIPITFTVGSPVFQQINPLSFTKAFKGGDPAPQVITVASTDATANFNYSSVVVNPANSTAGNWLSIGPSPGCCATTPQAITVNANPDVTLAVGTYTSEIILKSQNGNESVVVPVALTIEPPTSSSFDAEPGAFTFSMPMGGNTPAAFPLGIRNAGSSTLVWTGVSSTADGGSWLNLSPGGGTAPSTSSVSVNPANLPGQGLKSGSFIGQVVLQSAMDYVSIPATYTVSAAVFQQLQPLSFSKAYQGLNPAPQTITVASTGANFNYSSAVVNSLNSIAGNWLSITPSPGCCATTPKPITVTASPDINLQIGTYSAEIIFKSQDGTKAMVIPVTLTIGSNTQAATTPTFSPAGGTYASAQTVTISDATGSAIYYTTDGSQPTVKSALYSGPVQLTASGTLNAIAIASGYTQSATASATYTITGGQCAVIDNSGGFTATGLTLNGGATVTGNLLQLTNGGFDEARSAFSSERVPIDSFVTDFTFQLLDAYAEGFTFTVQGDGPQAVGASGGGLGYQGIPNSAALKIDLFDTAGEGYDSTGFYINGAAPTVPSIDLGQAGIDIHNGHPFAVHVANVNGVYAGSITDTVTGVSASTYLQGYSVPAGSMAFVGFTAGTSSEGSATQNILTWKYQGGTACGH